MVNANHLFWFKPMFSNRLRRCFFRGVVRLRRLVRPVRRDSRPLFLTDDDARLTFLLLLGYRGGI